MTLQIILIALLVYMLTGFLPGRPLKVKRGRWYYIGFFDKILFAVNGTTSFAFIPLPFLFRVIKIELTWTEYEKANETYQGGVQHYLNVEKAIGTKIEMTNIRHLEEHPIDIDVILKDGYKAALVFDVTLTVFDPMKLIPRKGFLTYVQQEFSDIVSPWAKANRDIDTVLEINIDILEKELPVSYGDQNYSLRSFLDEVKFIPYGFCIKELSLKAGLPAESQEYFKIKNRQKQEEAKKGELEAVERRREVERTIFKNDATTEREVQKLDLQVTEDYQKNILNAHYKGQKSVAAAYKSEVLVINGNDNSRGDVEKTKNLTDTITAGLITTRRLSELKESAEEKKPNTKKEDSK